MYYERILSWSHFLVTDCSSQIALTRPYYERILSWSHFLVTDCSSRIALTRPYYVCIVCIYVRMYVCLTRPYYVCIVCVYVRMYICLTRPYYVCIVCIYVRMYVCLTRPHPQRLVIGSTICKNLVEKIGRDLRGCVRVPRVSWKSPVSPLKEPYITP